MRPIEPVQVWFNGVEMEANRLNLYITNDNLKDTAQFYYALCVEEEIPTTTTTTGEGPTPPSAVISVGPPMKIIQVTQGNLTMTGQEYLDWDESSAGTINEAAFVWAAGKLNLTLV